MFHMSTKPKCTAVSRHDHFPDIKPPSCCPRECSNKKTKFPSATLTRLAPPGEPGAATGGTRGLGPHCPPLRSLSENPIRQSLVREKHVVAFVVEAGCVLHMFGNYYAPRPGNTFPHFGAVYFGVGYTTLQARRCLW